MGRGAVIPKTVNCPRCGRECVVTTEGSKDARPVRRTIDIRRGMCAECAVTAFIKATETLMYGINMHGPEKVLLVPHIQAGFVQLFHIGDSDLDITRLDWQRVVDNWDLEE